MTTSTPVTHPIPAWTARRALHFSRAKLPPAELIPIPAIAEAITAYTDLVEREKQVQVKRRALEAQRRAADDADREALARWHGEGGKGKRPEEAPNRRELEAKIATAEQDEDALGNLGDEADRALRGLLTEHGAEFVAKLTSRREAARARFAKALENLEAAKDALDGERSATLWAKGWSSNVTNVSTGATRRLRQFTPVRAGLDGSSWPVVRKALRSLASPPADPAEEALRRRGPGPHQTDVDLSAVDALKRDA